MSEDKNKNRALLELGQLIVVLGLTVVFLLADARFFRAESKTGASQKEEWQNIQESTSDNAKSDEQETSGKEAGKDVAEGSKDSNAEPTSEEQISEESTTLEDNLKENNSKENISEENTSEEEIPGENTEPESQEKEQLEFTTAPEGYFDDALFIGDSRTVGLYEYGGIEGADFFATTGMNVYEIDNEKVNVGDKGTISFEDLITRYSYGKIYLMLGINELGYGLDETVEEYKALVGRIREAQPEAVLFIEANLHVSAKRSAQDPVHNNQNIDYFNNNISVLADNESIFYIDVNVLFDDEGGNLRADTTVDETHPLGRYYKQWADWLAENAIIK